MAMKPVGTTKFDADLLTVQLNQVADKSITGGAEILRKTMLDIIKLADDLAPHKSGTLDGSISGQDNLAYKITNSKDEKRRTQYTIEFDPETTSPGGRSVAVYGPIMEKGLTPVGPLQLGEGSEQKNDGKIGANSRGGIDSIPMNKRVGGHFLERAVLAYRGILGKRLREAMAKAVKK